MLRSSIFALSLGACAPSTNIADSAVLDGPASDATSMDAPPLEGLGTATVNLEGDAGVVPDGFVGLSMEYAGHRALLGVSPTEPNVVVRRLLRALGPGTLRIGGNSTDETCYSGIDAPEPRGCRETLTPDDLRVLADVARETNWRLLMGVNLAQNSPAMAVRYVREQVLSSLPRASLVGVELGNEPDLFASHAFYRTDADAGATQVSMRPATWLVDDLVTEFGAIADALRSDPVTSSLPLAGPAFAGVWSLRSPPGSAFTSALSARLGFFTGHYYSFTHCSGGNPGSVDALLSAATMTRFETFVNAAVSATQRSGKSFALSEANSSSCGGTPGVSDTFASALWGLDFLFTAAQAGVTTVHLHGNGGSVYNPITVRVTREGGSTTYDVSVRPLYYAMALFAQAQGARLLPVTTQSTGANLKVWAVLPACGSARCAPRVFVLNKDRTQARSLTLRMGQTLGPATIVALQAPSADATNGVTLGGASVDATTGTLAAPQTSTVQASAPGTYVLNVPSATALSVRFE